MKRTFALAALIGAAASFPASKLKAATESPLQRGAEALWPATEQDKELVGTDPTGHPDNMPPAVLADRVAQRLGRGRLSTLEKLRIQNVVHYSSGAFFGATYGVLAEVFPAATAGTGTAAGIAVYATGHATALPLLHVQEPPWRLPRAALAWEFTSHLLFGLALELSRRSFTGIASSGYLRRNGRSHAVMPTAVNGSRSDRRLRRDQLLDTPR
jgi:putative membrane protein